MWNHGRAYGEPIQHAGHKVKYLLDSDFDWMPKDSDLHTHLFAMRNTSNPFLGFCDLGWSNRTKPRRIFEEDPPQIVFITNLNPIADRLVVHLARKANPSVRINCLLHEPYTEGKKVYGWKRAILLHGFGFLCRGMVKKSTAVVLPSENAKATFDRHYSSFTGISRLIPLTFFDERWHKDLDRVFFTFLGHVENAHQKGLDLFLDMVEESVNRPGDYAFQLITGKNPEEALKVLSSTARKRLRVVHQDQLSDARVNKALTESIAVILLQRRMMQSGALSSALVNGTPAIVSDLEGVTQFVKDGETGVVLPVEPTLDQRFEALDRVRAHSREMSENSRRPHEQTFDSRLIAPEIP